MYVVVGAIALTLQPLWPDSSREALWYLSVAVFFAMAVIVALIVGEFVGMLVISVGYLSNLSGASNNLSGGTLGDILVMIIDECKKIMRGMYINILE